MPIETPNFDDDNPEWTEADFRRSRPASELPPDILDAFPNTPRPDAVAVPISLDIVRHFQAQGHDWEKRIDALLRDAIRDEEAAA